jgi:hypothetical protein
MLKVAPPDRRRAIAVNVDQQNRMHFAMKMLNGAL